MFFLHYIKLFAIFIDVGGNGALGVIKVDEMTKQEKLVIESCRKIKTLSQSMSQSELVEVISDMNFPLSFHLAVMGHLNFVCKAGRLPTKSEIKLGLA